jgi:SAM-dependent methyltransferase
MTSATPPTETQFWRNAEQYARSAVFARSDSLDEMVRVTNPQPDWRVLDVATGGGHTALTYAPLVALVTATDVAQPMLDAAARLAAERSLGNIAFEPADAEALPYPPASFDLVTCRIAPHHFSDPGQAVREMARVCRPGGLVAVIDGIAPADRASADAINAWEALRDPSHVALLTVTGWSALFCAAGLEAVHLNTFSLWLDFDEHMRRAGCDADTALRLRRMLLESAGGMRDWLKPSAEGGRLSFNWSHILLVGRKGSG